MNKIPHIAKLPEIRACLDYFTGHRRELEELIIEVQQVPSPTFSEGARADFVQLQLTELGLKDVSQDAMHNVFGRYPGTDADAGLAIILSAHLDTVFSADTDLTIQRDGERLCGPGIGDNATGVAGLIFLAKTLREHQIVPQADLWFVFNAGEEGLGDLRGMRAVVDRFGEHAIYLVVEGGSYGQIMYEAIGVSRFRVDIETDGGHSWGSFGQPSAVHEMGHLISEIANITVPARPRTTFNVGVVEGGTTINSIAARSSMLLDLRSEDTKQLKELVKKFRRIIATRQSLALAQGKSITYYVFQVGNRPAGALSASDPLIGWAKAGLEYVGCSPIKFIAGSTDANIPLSRGLRAVCVGLAHSGNSHRSDEFIELDQLPRGMQQLMLLTMAAGGV